MESLNDDDDEEEQKEKQLKNTKNIIKNRKTHISHNLICKVPRHPIGTDITYGHTYNNNTVLLFLNKHTHRRRKRRWGISFLM